MNYRLKSGVAASLNYVNLNKAQNEKSPKLTPYPDWKRSFVEIDSKNTANQTQSAASANATTPTVPPIVAPPTKPIITQDTIISAFQIRVDRCNRLWVLDSGMVNILEKNSKQIQMPAIVIFNLNADMLIRRAEFDKKFTQENSIFMNMVSVVWSIRRIIIVIMHSCIVYFFLRNNIGR